MLPNLPMFLFLAPFLGALLCAMVGWRWRAAATAIAAVTMLLTAALSVWAAVHVWTTGPITMYLGGWKPDPGAAPIGIVWKLDQFSALMAMLVSVVGAVVTNGALASVKRQLTARSGVFHACALLLISGLLGMTISSDLFNVFVHLEVASLSSYALVAAGKRPAARAAMDYLVIGSIGASLYLLGVGFIYASTGALNMDDAAARLLTGDPRLNAVALLLIVVGLGIKMGLFPVHSWLPTAYAAAPSAASALMAPLSTKIAAYALVRVLLWVFPATPSADTTLVLQALCWAGAIGMVFGALKAAVQTDLLRLLGYSSVSQMGLVALGLGLANTDSVSGAIMHIVNDGLMKGSLFLAAAALVMRFSVRHVRDLRRLRGRSPLITTVFVIVGLSLVGIPPLCGFYGKWYVLIGALDANAWLFAAAIGLSTLATAVYVFRLYEQLLFAPLDNDTHHDHGPKGSRVLTAGSLLLAGGVIAVGVFNQPFVTHIIRPMLPGGL